MTVDCFVLLQTETLSSEKEALLASMETTRSTVRQLEAQNQELQRQSASLDRDLLAERAMKEQKIKVKIRRDGYSVLLLCTNSQPPHPILYLS